MKSWTMKRELYSAFHIISNRVFKVQTLLKFVKFCMALLSIPWLANVLGRFGLPYSDLQIISSENGTRIV